MTDHELMRSETRDRTEVTQARPTDDSARKPRINTKREGPRTPCTHASCASARASLTAVHSKIWTA
eukprot:8612997-Pyramimonas_sp.AAC.1